MILSKTNFSKNSVETAHEEGRMICPSLNQLRDTTVSFGVDCAHENGVIIVINEEIMSPFSSFSFVVLSL